MHNLLSFRQLMSHMQIPPHLKYVSDEEPGYKRLKEGELFVYVDWKGNKLSDKEELSRIEQLVIPPIWSDTWICADPSGHLQSTGKDLRKRKQYIYHPDWVSFRQKTKFDKLREFGEKLPEIRKKLQRLLEKEGYDKEKILAISVKLLDTKYLRVGNDFYLNQNDTYGLTTLRRKHIKEQEEGLRISYKAKSGKERNISIENPELITLLKEINELPGYEVFRYKEGRQFHRIDSSDINDFIRYLADEDFTAKDFRTWGGTVGAVDSFEEAYLDVQENSRKKLDTGIVRRVSKILGNTVATSRDYYIHPKVLEELCDMDLEAFRKKQERLQTSGIFRKTNEAFVLDILD